MGATLVKKAYKTWGKRLGGNAFRVLIVMAVTALDDGNARKAPCLYHDGHDALAEALQDSDTKSRAALVKATQRALEELLSVGAIELVKQARSQGKSEYRLTLDREPGRFERDLSRLEKLRSQVDTTGPAETDQQDTTRPADVTSPDAFQVDTTRPPESEAQQDTTCPPEGEEQVDTTGPAQVDTTGPIQVDTTGPALTEEPLGTNEEPSLFASLTTEPEATKPAAPKARKGRPKKPKTLIPDDFRITTAMRAWAAEHCPDVDIDRHTMRFINHAHENDRMLASWERGWQNWMLLEQPDRRRRTPSTRANGHVPYTNPLSPDAYDLKGYK